ncbi:MAG: type II toxin-antitoxin system VapC family toxin [Verrucomicrobiales bacterium]|nr:type II toxin-antitoxin system VapC family toxin [Verrucomicrobiales bacterium]
MDTNAYSDWVRGGAWSEEIASAEGLIIPAIVLGELREGFLRGSRVEWNERNLMGMLEQAVVKVAEIKESTSHHFAVFKKYLRDTGRPIPENDVWIAACCYEHGGVLLTRDKHFENLPQVRVKYLG